MSTAEHWVPAKFRGEDVYIREDVWYSNQSLIPMKYSDNYGAKIYNANRVNIEYHASLQESEQCSADMDPNPYAYDSNNYSWDWYGEDDDQVWNDRHDDPFLNPPSPKRRKLDISNTNNENHTKKQTKKNTHKDNTQSTKKATKSKNKSKKSDKSKSKQIEKDVEKSSKQTTINIHIHGNNINNALPKPLNKLTVSELKIELRNRNLGVAGKRDELRQRLFEAIKLSDSHIESMDKLQLLEQFQTLKLERGLTKWTCKDLQSYLKFIYQTIDNFSNRNSRAQTNLDASKHLSQQEFDDMPLHLIQDCYGFNRSQTSRKKLYQECVQRWQQTRQHEKQRQDNIDKLVTPIKQRLFKSTIQSNMQLISKVKDDHDFKNDKEKVVIMHGLDSSDRATIHMFAENNGLISVSAGNDGATFKKVMGISRACDKSILKKVVSDEERKLSSKIQAKAKSETDGMIEKNLALRKMEQQNNPNSWKVGGEWKMLEYVDCNRHFRTGTPYLRIFDDGPMVSISFLFEGIEGSMKLIGSNHNPINQTNNKFKIKWRGRDSGTSEIVLGDKTGYVEFSEFGTKLKGVIDGCYGKMPFNAIKVANVAADFQSGFFGKTSRYQFDYDSDEEEQYHEEARMSRWH